MNSSLYLTDTILDDNGVKRRNEAPWNPIGKEAIDQGFRDCDDLLICGLDYDGEEPDEFVALGHGHTRAAMVTAARVWMGDCYPAAKLGPFGPPVEQHAVFLRHPHPDHPCACEWEGQWRAEYVPATESGAIAVTVMTTPGRAS